MQPPAHKGCARLDWSVLKVSHTWLIVLPIFQRINSFDICISFFHSVEHAIDRIL